MSLLETRLADLTRHFDELLERQENMLAICEGQGEAALANDMAVLEARTTALAVLIQENAEAEKERLLILKDIVAELALPEEKQTLSGLIACVPAPWSRRLAEYQERLRYVLNRTREEVRDNHLRLRRSMKVVGDAIGLLADSLPGATQAPYTALGAEGPAGAVPSFLDRKG